MKKIQDPALSVNEFARFSKLIEEKKQKVISDSEKNIAQIDYEIKQLKYEEERLFENAKRNSAAKKMEQELQQLNVERNKVLQQKTNYIREVNSLESKITEYNKETPDNNPKAALALYKSIANIGITGIRNNKINGVIAGGSRESTKFFEYDLSQDNVSDLLWKDLRSTLAEGQWLK